MLRCIPEDVVGLKHLVEREFVRDELLGRKLVLGDKLQQHPEGVRVDQAHGDVDVLDPELIKGEIDRLAVHTDVGDIAAWANDDRCHGERLGNPDRLDGDIDPRGHP